jgi:Protein of unknown function (DUF3099)
LRDHSLLASSDLRSCPVVSAPRWQAGGVGRRRLYLGLMGSCLVLFLLAWTVVSRYSVTAAFVISAVAALIPPAAAIVANSRADR